MKVDGALGFVGAREFWGFCVTHLVVLEAPMTLEHTLKRTGLFGRASGGEFKVAF